MLDAKLEIREKNINKRLVREVKDAVRKLKDLGQIPKSMNYFFDRINEYYIEGKLNDDIYIGTTCIQVPDELIYALGVKPVRLCSGVNNYNNLGAQILPANTCPLVKSTAGSIICSSHFQKNPPLMIINPMTCDQKKKLGETSLNEYTEWYNLQVPSTKDDALAQYYWNVSIKKLVKKLESKTKKKITKKSLKEAINLVAKAQSAFRKLHDLRAEGNNILGSYAFLVANTYFFDDIKTWTENLEFLVHEISEQKTEVKNNAPRLLLTGSPSIFPNLNLPIMLEQLDALVAADEFCSSNRLLYDMLAVDEWQLYDMIPALADKYLKPTTCPSFVPNDDRIRRILSLIKSHHIDGVVYQVFQGCHLYDIESSKVLKSLKEKDIPVLLLETDYSPDESGQMQTRIEAFLDSLPKK